MMMLLSSARNFSAICRRATLYISLAQTSTLWTLCAALNETLANQSAPLGLNFLGFHGILLGIYFLSF